MIKENNTSTIRKELRNCINNMTINKDNRKGYNKNQTRNCSSINSNRFYTNKCNTNLYTR